MTIIAKNGIASEVIILDDNGKPLDLPAQRITLVIESGEFIKLTIESNVSALKVVTHKEDK